jgi:serine/threonine protein kinase
MYFQSIDNNYIPLLKNIQSYFYNSHDSIHKARNEIKIIDFEGERLVVKSFKIPNAINKIVYTIFKDSKAKKSYENSVKIIDFVPKPIGYIEFKKFGLIDESYFVSEKFDYDFTIREPLLQADFKDKEEVFKAFSRFTYNLHEKDIFHLDYSPGNILIKEENGTYVFKIVDINRMEFKPLNLDDRLKNFAKLWAKDEDLKTIVKEYARLSSENEQKCIDIALQYSQEHKDRKNAKKRLRGEAVVD